MNRWLAASPLPVLALFAAATVHAEPAAPAPRDIAPAKAAEIAFATGVTQGLGGGSAPNVPDAARVGAGFDFSIGYRASPAWLVGVYATTSQFATGSNVPSGDVVSGGAGVHVERHFAPGRTLDPWLGIGAGWRGYWVTYDQGGTSVRHGIDFMRLRVGVDYRATHDVSVGPFLAAHVATFFAESLAAEDKFRASSGITAFLLAGIGGRFDIAPEVTTTSAPTTASR